MDVLGSRCSRTFVHVATERQPVENQYPQAYFRLKNGHLPVRNSFGARIVRCAKEWAGCPIVRMDHADSKIGCECERSDLLGPHGLYWR